MYIDFFFLLVTYIFFRAWKTEHFDKAKIISRCYGIAPPTDHGAVDISFLCIPRPNTDHILAYNTAERYKSK